MAAILSRPQCVDVTSCKVWRWQPQFLMIKWLHLEYLLGKKPKKTIRVRHNPTAQWSRASKTTSWASGFEQSFLLYAIQAGKMQYLESQASRKFCNGKSSISDLGCGLQTLANSLQGFKAPLLPNTWGVTWNIADLLWLFASCNIICLYTLPGAPHASNNGLDFKNLTHSDNDAS